MRLLRIFSSLTQIVQLYNKDIIFIIFYFDDLSEPNSAFGIINRSFRAIHHTYSQKLCEHSE